MACKKRKIVIMGGSFNPPTLAHYMLMKYAIDALDAEAGYFVPVSDAYLRRKMRHTHPPVILTPELRVKMLQVMCNGDIRMKVCDKEIGEIKASTLPTLKSFKEEFPEHELFFLMGDDKLDLLSHLAEKTSFFEITNVILYSRSFGEIERVLNEHKILSTHINKIVIFSQPEGTKGISSSLIRTRMLSGESCKDLLFPEVWNLFKKLKPVDFPDVIDSFIGEYDFLNNRFRCSFEWQGIRYDNAEAAFQASKCTDEAERRYFSKLSADKATIKGTRLNPYSGWNEQKLDIMQSIILAKFVQNQSLMIRLIDTGNRVIINGNNKHETYWGVDLYSWKGENNLGKILMKIRDKES